MVTMNKILSINKGKRNVMLVDSKDKYQFFKSLVEINSK